MKTDKKWQKMSEKVIYARYRARASSKHRFFAFLTSPMDSPCKNTQDRGAPPRENFHVDKKKYSYEPHIALFGIIGAAAQKR